MTLRRLLLGLFVVVLLVPAGALTVARVAQPPGGAWIRLVSFTPYAFALYAAAFVLLLVAWAGGTGRWRSSVRALSLVAVVGVAVHGLWMSGAYVGDAAVARGEPLRVMTLNLMLGQAAPAGVVELAVERDIDVLALQEVDRAALRGMRDAGLREVFPHTAGAPAQGAAGTMVFSKRRLGEVSRLPTAFGGYELRLGDVTLIVVHPRPPVGEADGWAEDHRAIRHAAFERDGPALIVGDLNATTDHRVMRELIGRGYEDAATAAASGWQPTWPADAQVIVAGLPVPSLLAIDHVLTNGFLQAVATETVAVEGTDHRALVAILSR